MRFESDVISDGTQTMLFADKEKGPFESDVISDGTQTQKNIIIRYASLRVM